MAVRRFGPTRGAGVAVIELEGEKTIEPGALGMVAYAGLLPKGPVGELIQTFSKTQSRKVVGSATPFDDGSLPINIEHYFENAAGAGAVHLVRVTDGNELQAALTLFARNTALPVPMGTVQAANGGRWGGKRKEFTAAALLADVLTEITFDTGIATFTTDEWKGGFLEFHDIPNKRFGVVGNTNTGIVTVEADQLLITELAAAAAADPLRYYLVLENLLDTGDTRALSILIQDGEEVPAGEFALSVIVDGELVKKYPNLHTDPANGRYWVSVINDDGGNDEIFVTDLVTGAHVPNTRPANKFQEIATLTATELTAIIHDFTINSPVALGDPTFALGTTNNDMLAQKITLTMIDPTSATAVSDKFGALGTVTLGVLFDPPNAGGGALKNKWTPSFTVTAGGAPLAAADTLVVNYKPFIPSSLIDGRLFPDKVGEPLVRFRITANDHKKITVADGSDMTIDAIAGDKFMVEAALDLSEGRDGNADIIDSDFVSQAYDVELSPFTRLFDRNFGLVKMATPGETATGIQKAGVAYAAAKNYQYRYEIPANILTDTGAIDQVNDTLGRSDYAVVSFPSFGSILDPESSDGKLKEVPATGAAHGREARLAVDNDGYHKAAAGIEAILPQFLDIPTGERVLNEEILNPVGVNVIKKKKGNFVLWGDRTLALDPTWKFKHQREQMSFYENVLRESFDFIVFAINDPITEKIALAALRSFFFPEFVKRALRGKTFEDAATIKIDGENNTDATRATGDLFADIRLQLADTVERFVIRIGKQGIFDGAA